MSTALLEEPVVDPLSFSATDVTGTHDLEFTVDGHRFASDVANSVAHAMELPTGPITWALRNDQSAKMLLDEQPVGQQVRPGAELVVIPKAHLG